MYAFGSATMAGIYFAVFGGWVFDQRRCRRWLRSGQWTLTEGEVAGYESRSIEISRSRKGTRVRREVTFRVGQESFLLTTDPPHGGFRLNDLDWIGDHTAFIWNGVRLRVTHHEGRILRIEVIDKYVPLFPESSPAQGSTTAAEPVPHREKGTTYVRITAPPPWPVPPEMCRAWVGMELPLSPDSPGSRPKEETRRPAASSRRKYGEPWRSLFHRMTESQLFKDFSGRNDPPTEYIVDAPRAVELLAEKVPWAAKWWREHSPQWCQAGSTFTFPAEVCQAIVDTPVPTSNTADAILPDALPSTPPPLTPGRRLRKWLIRAACVAHAVILAAGIIDYIFGGRKGFGPWIFAATGWFGGMLGAWGGYRLNRRLAKLGDVPAPIGETRTSNNGWPVLLLLGLVFSGIGLWTVLSFRADPPANASQVVIDRFNAQLFMQWLLGPLFLAAGGAGLAIGLALLGKWVRRL
jgi:hypothetical protein